MSQTVESNFAQQILQEAQDVPLPEPSDGIVDLPGGWVDGAGELHKQALIRELSGADEEALSRATRKGGIFDPLLFLDTALERGLVSIGGRPADPAMRTQLLLGDRDAILLAVRIATYGNDLEANLDCPTCGIQSRVAFELDKDVKQRTLKDPKTWWREVPLKNGRIARVHLVTVADQMVALKEDGRTAAEIDTIILGRCVSEIGGSPVIGEETMLKLPAGDRRKLAKYLTDTQPGPLFGEVKGVCPACKADVPYPLSLPALFL